MKKAKGHYRPRIAQIELLRAIAMGGIFAFHLWSVDPQVNHSGLAGRIMGTAASYGYLGVMIFNFITGFVLALPHLGPQHKQSLPYSHFLRRRFFRICPKYYIALSVWTLVLLFSARQNAKNLLLSYLAHLTFLHSIFPSTFFSIVPAFWWLGLLAQFYLVFPLILAGFIRIGPARACFLTCLVCWGSWIILDHFSHP
ncbi:MAG: acyltransferase, partial [Desulfoferrobacter sp.]